MIINIPDELEGKERKKQLRLQPALYALQKFKTFREASRFLGTNRETLRKIIREYDELEEYRNTGKSSLPLETLVAHSVKNQKYLEMLKRYPNE